MLNYHTAIYHFYLLMASIACVGLVAIVYYFYIAVQHTCVEWRNPRVKNRERDS